MSAPHLSGLRVPLVATLPAFLVACAATGFEGPSAETTDTRTGDDDTSRSDVPDISLPDSGPSDVRRDTFEPGPDTSRPDTSVDTSRPDTSEPDVPPPDAGRDGGRDGGRDTGTTDTGTDMMRIPRRAPDMTTVDCEAPATNLEEFYCGITFTCEMEYICYGGSPDLGSCRQEYAAYFSEEYGGRSIDARCPDALTELASCYRETLHESGCDDETVYAVCEPLFDPFNRYCGELFGY